MHKKIATLVDKALHSIEFGLRMKFPDEYIEKYKLVVSELAKIRHDGAGEGFQYYSDIYYKILDITGISSENTEWDDAIYDIGHVLCEDHTELNGIARAEYATTASDFKTENAEELYHKLIGVAELGVMHE